jgi:hypothetical protein
MTVQLDELNMAVQTVLLGRLPLAIIKPDVLHGILRNLSLIIPETYELIAGVRLQDIHKYYELISTSMVGDAHGLYLILEIPLKSANQIFSLYRIVSLPVKIVKDTFAVYSLDYQFIGWTYDQRDYVRMTELDLRACKTGSITVCPANTAILDAQTNTCEAQFYFQRSTKEQTCRRKLMLRYDTPTLVRYGSRWIYHFPTPSRVTSRCPRDSVWNIEVHTLEVVGLVESATDCELATEGSRTIPELHGTARYTAEMPMVLPPVDIPVIGSHEMPEVKAALTSGIRELESVRDSVMTSRKTMEVDTLLHVSNRLPRLETAPRWYGTAAIAVGTTLAMVTVYLVARRAHRRFAKRPPGGRTQDRNAVPLREVTTDTENVEQRQEGTVYTYAATG